MLPPRATGAPAACAGIRSLGGRQCAWARACGERAAARQERERRRGERALLLLLSPFKNFWPASFPPFSAPAAAPEQQDCLGQEVHSMAEAVGGRERACGTVRGGAQALMVFRKERRQPLFTILINQSTHRVAEARVQAIAQLLHAGRDLVEGHGHPPPVALDDIHPEPLFLGVFKREAETRVQISFLLLFGRRGRPWSLCGRRVKTSSRVCVTRERCSLLLCVCVFFVLRV